MDEEQAFARIRAIRASWWEAGLSCCQSGSVRILKRKATFAMLSLGFADASLHFCVYHDDGPLSLDG